MTSVYHHHCVLCGIPAPDGFLMINPGLLLDVVRTGITDAFSEETGWPVRMWLPACDNCSSVWSEDWYSIPLSGLRYPYQLDEWEGQLKEKSWFSYTNWSQFSALVRGHDDNETSLQK